MRRVAAVLCLLIVVLSGCGSIADNPQEPTPSTRQVSTTTTSIGTTSSATTTAKQSSETTTEQTFNRPQVDNPWEKEPVIIVIDNSLDPERNYTTVVRRAVKYWNTTGRDAASWNPHFDVRPHRANPDIVVRFVNEVGSCGSESTDIVIGCASVLEPDSRPEHPEVVLINLGLTNESTYRVVRHELGHVLGLRHTEGPEGVMTPYDRVFDRVIRVSLTHETTAKALQRDSERQAGVALDYYASGAEGHVNEEVEFAVVQDRETADLVIEFHERGDRSTAYTENGTTTIEVKGIDVDRRGWHVGYWLGFYFGAQSVDQLPPPFDEPRSDPREGWWH